MLTMSPENWLNNEFRSLCLAAEWAEQPRGTDAQRRVRLTLTVRRSGQRAFQMMAARLLRITRS